MKIGLEKTGLMVSRDAMVFGVDRTFIFPSSPPPRRGNGMEFFHPVGTHTRHRLDDACSITILMNGLPRRIAI